MYLLNLNRLQKVFCVLFATGILLGCQKDDAYVNLTATLSLKQTQLSVTEGGRLKLDIQLSHKLSEKLPLRLEIDTLQTSQYINFNDYENTVELSVDGGRTWRSQTLNRVVIPTLSTNVQIRLQTIDDNLVRIHRIISMENTS